MNLVRKLSKTTKSESFSRKRKRVVTEIEEKTTEEEEKFITDLYRLQVEVFQNAEKYEKFLRKGEYFTISEQFFQDKKIRTEMENKTKELSLKVQSLVKGFGLDLEKTDNSKEKNNQQDNQIKSTPTKVAREDILYKLEIINNRFENDRFGNVEIKSIDDFFKTKEIGCQTNQVPTNISKDSETSFSQSCQTESDLMLELDELRLLKEFAVLDNEIRIFREKQS